MKNCRRAIFLDRDGVINRAYIEDGKPLPAKNLDSLEILPGVREATSFLSAAGFHLCIVTNQPDISRGKVRLEDVEKIHSYLEHELNIDEIRMCIHDDLDCCDCRKPKSGMLISCALEHNIDLKKSYMIGDRWRDIEAGQGAGCKTFFVNYRYAEQQPEMPDFIVSSLLEAQKIITGEF
jgi:D-glycero-D-manno-heptose 1,7-bisphosphate phosphatase